LQWILLLIAFADGTDTESTPEVRFERLADLPPSAKLVYKVLETEGALTQSRLVEETLLARRTVRHAVTQLETADLVEVRVYVLDARKKLYHPRPVTRPE
jgi:DNA-binding MarR family transcriptional regulator